jgi:hypothetical protein
VSASLRTQTTENMKQCKSEGKDCERLKGAWNSVSLRKETLKNRKEARF